MLSVVNLKALREQLCQALTTYLTAIQRIYVWFLLFCHQRSWEMLKQEIWRVSGTDGNFSVEFLCSILDQRIPAKSKKSTIINLNLGSPLMPRKPQNTSKRSQLQKCWHRVELPSDTIHFKTQCEIVRTLATQARFSYLKGLITKNATNPKSLLGGFQKTFILAQECSTLLKIGGSATWRQHSLHCPTAEAC